MLVAGGVAALLSSVGIITRLAARTKTGKSVVHYENCIIAGCIIGNAIDVFKPEMNLVNIPVVWGIIISLIGIFMGMFVGCLAMSLAEALDATSIFFRRLGIKKYLWMIVLAVAIGKFVGNLFYFFKIL